MPSIDNMISDVELRLSHAKPSDDFAIPREQIRFWLDTASASLMSEWIKKRNGGEVPAQIIKPYDCLLVQTETDTCIGNCNTRQHIQLPQNSDGTTKGILALPNDGGIVQLLQGSNQIMRVTNIAQLGMNLKLEFSSKFAYFVRVADKIYLFNGVFPSYCKLTAYIASCDTTDMADTENYPTIDELIPSILEQAEKIGLRELQTKIDLQDDGIPT